jgi:transposase-like protein
MAQAEIRKLIDDVIVNCKGNDCAFYVQINNVLSYVFSTYKDDDIMDVIGTKIVESQKKFADAVEKTNSIDADTRYWLQVIGITASKFVSKAKK